MDNDRVRHLQSALTKSGDRDDIYDVLYDLASGHAQLWETTNATVVTQVADHSTYRCLNVWLAGGDLDEILSLLDQAEEWALSHGCDTIEVTGRRGWKRVLAPLGRSSRGTSGRT